MAAIYQVGGDHSALQTQLGSSNNAFAVQGDNGNWSDQYQGDLNNATVFKMIFLLEDLMKRDKLKEVRNIAIIDQGFLGITSNSDATQTQQGDNNNASNVMQHGDKIHRFKVK
jgi:hypothetical protein